MSALVNPTLAKQLLTQGISSPYSMPPVDPSSDLGKVLTKVANNQPVTAAELEKQMSLIKDKAIVSKSFMDNIMAQGSARLQQIQADQKKAAQKGDPGAV
jgi:hypothetical protein